MRKAQLASLAIAAAALLTLVVIPATAGDGPGFKTSQPAMLTGVGGTTVTPIISVGDNVGDYMFEAIPDGISFSKINGNGTADILVNHELSLVPFPATRQDPSNALLSEIRLHQKSAGVLRGRYVIPSSAAYQRFCSNFLVGSEHGFERELLFTNEEARDIVLRQPDSWHQPGVQLTEPGAEQAGVVVAYDVKSGDYRSIYGMGRHNHENAVGVPGYGYPVVLSGDDTFDAPASQLYLYKAASGAAVWNDQGSLYAFVSNTPTVNDYGDLSTASPSVTGHFIEVPRAIATGKINGREVTSADFGYPTPGAADPPQPLMPDGPQWVLEHWSNINNVFQFIRIEDIAYDRANGKTVYFADTGEPRARPHRHQHASLQGRDGRPVHERPALQARHELVGSARDGNAVDPPGRELRRSRLQQCGGAAPAGQHRVDRQCGLLPGGSRARTIRSRPSLGRRTHASGVTAWRRASRPSRPWSTSP